METWLSTDILDNEVAIPHYSLLRSDGNRHGGGVAIYVHCSILFNVLLSGPPSLELIMVSLTKNSFKLCLCVFYRPPSTCADIFDNLCEALFSVDVSFFCNFLLVGDFNVDFNNPSGHLYPHVSNLMHTFSLSQVVDSPTHFSHSGHPSLIDLAFVSTSTVFWNAQSYTYSRTQTTLVSQSLCNTLAWLSKPQPVALFGDTNMKQLTS